MRPLMRYAVALLAIVIVVSCSSPQSACDSKSCPGCCTAAGECISGSSQQACGTAGGACIDCSQRHSSCDPTSRVCIIAPDGGGAGGGGGATGGGTGTDVYPDGGSWYRYWDGGSCATKTDCPCFSSDDCGPGFTCVSEDSSGTNVWCKPGVRGAGGPGVTCTGEAQCFSALCVSGASTAQYCSGLCDTAADCPANLPRCQYVGFGVERSICAP